MTAEDTDAATPRIPLSRERVVVAAVQLADHEGLGALSMRRLGQEVGVEAMSLYNHVANKEALLDGMTEWVMGEITLVAFDGDWKSTLRQQILEAREVMFRHPWAPEVIESRVNMTPPMLSYFDAVIGIMRQGGLSLDLIHHSLHTLGSRMIGFTQELFDDADTEAEDDMVEMMLTQMADVFPNLVAMMELISHDDDPILGQSGCDSQAEFIFTIDLMLGGIERLAEAEAAANPA